MKSFQSSLDKEDCVQIRTSRGNKRPHGRLRLSIFVNKMLLDLKVADAHA